MNKRKSSQKELLKGQSHWRHKHGKNEDQKKFHSNTNKLMVNYICYNGSGIGRQPDLHSITHVNIGPVWCPN